jgi:hypothetical protein
MFYVNALAVSTASSPTQKTVETVFPRSSRFTGLKPGVNEKFARKEI